MCYRHFRFESWYGPAIQVQTLNGLMEINSLAVNDLTREHSRKCEGRKGIQKLEPGQNIHQLSNWLEFYSSGFCSEIRDFCHLEDIILSVGVPVSDPSQNSFIDTNLNTIFYINYIKLSSSTCFERHPLIFRRSMMLIVHVRSLWYSHFLQVAVLCTC